MWMESTTAAGGPTGRVGAAGVGAEAEAVGGTMTMGMVSTAGEAEIGKVAVSGVAEAEAEVKGVEARKKGTTTEAAAAAAGVKVAIVGRGVSVSGVDVSGLPQRMIGPAGDPADRRVPAQSWRAGEGAGWT